MLREGIYTKYELTELEVLEQAWDGDELVMNSGDEKVWLTHPENRSYNGDYTLETICPITGGWVQESFLFKK
jgi:hypothetical protein